MGVGGSGPQMQWGRQQPVIRSGTGDVGDFKRRCIVKAKSIVRNLELEEVMVKDREACCATVHGVTKRWP